MTVVVEPELGVAFGVSVAVTEPTGLVDDGFATVVVVPKLVGSVIPFFSMLDLAKGRRCSLSLSP